MMVVAITSDDIFASLLSDSCNSMFLLHKKKKKKKKHVEECFFMSRTALQRKGAHARTELRADARGKRREASVKPCV